MITYDTRFSFISSKSSILLEFLSENIQQLSVKEDARLLDWLKTRIKHDREKLQVEENRGPDERINRVNY